jgi:hypothetical protein
MRIVFENKRYFFNVKLIYIWHNFYKNDSFLYV